MKTKLFFLLLFVSMKMMATISLPSFFSDNMVLQRNSTITFWGWANPKEHIKIKTSWDSKEYTTTGNNEANWSIAIPTPKEGGPYQISFQGYNTVTLQNILIGEVWLCSGQSNMEMSASWGITNGEEEIKKANHPNIRFFNVAKSAADYPQQNVIGNWVECSPETMPYQSAVAYFFANRVTEELKNVPIGLIVSAWGGSSAEVWIPKNVIDSNAELSEAAKKINANEYCPVGPGKTFHSMIHPLVGYQFKGVLWYQGESNVGANTYDKTFAALINSWRELWKADFPFYFVQIAPYKNGNDRYSSVQIRDFQRRTLALPNTAMVVTSDISTTDDIHPKNKKAVGIRLANLALTNLYKTNNNLVNGPLYRSIEIKKNTITVNFDYADGLYFKDSKSNSFEIAGQDNLFYPAKAVIQKNTILLSSENVKQPVKVRFAWHNEAQPQLFNKANLPASSFITE